MALVMMSSYKYFMPFCNNLSSSVKAKTREEKGCFTTSTSGHNRLKNFDRILEMARPKPCSMRGLSPFSITFSSSNSTDDEASSTDHDSWSHVQLASKPQVEADCPPRRTTSPPTRMFDRYLNRNLSLPSGVPFVPEQLVHYMVHRRYYRKKGIKRKLFQITDARTSDVLAGAKFASIASSVLKVSNHRGLVCEVDVKGSSGPFVMRLGIEPYLVLTRGSNNSVTVEFMEFDGTVPPYSQLMSAQTSLDALVATFGTRRAMKSVKNCRLCRGTDEIIAVRKVQKNRLEIDSKRNVSFLSCFVIGLFMFLSKP
jgi:hypothetical protein